MYIYNITYAYFHTHKYKFNNTYRIDKTTWNGKQRNNKNENQGDGHFRWGKARM